jgi:hypothetical protein
VQRRAGGGSDVHLCAELIASSLPDFSETNNSGPHDRIETSLQRDQHDKNASSRRKRNRAGRRASRTEEKQIPIAGEHPATYC